MRYLPQNNKFIEYLLTRIAMKKTQPLFYLLLFNYMAMKKFILFLIIIISGKIIFAQDNDDFAVKRPVNSIYINLLGDASIISINYERILSIDSPVIWTSKLGLGYNQESQWCLWGCPTRPPYNYITIPHHITGNLGRGKRFFEFGLGGTIIIGNTTEPYIPYPIIGYRRFLQVEQKTYVFRIFIQFPFSGDILRNDIVFIPFGLSWGRSF